MTWASMFMTKRNLISFEKKLAKTQRQRFVYQCKNCEESFLFHEEIYFHELHSHDVKHKILQCKDCPSSYLSPQLFEAHKHCHNLDGDAPILCDFCEFTSTSFKDMAQQTELEFATKEKIFEKLIQIVSESYRTNQQQ